MSLHYLVKSGCCKFLPNTGFVTIILLRFVVKVKKAQCRDNFLAQRPLPDMRRLSGDDFYVSTGRHPGASARDTVAFLERGRDARNASSSKRLCPCTRGTFRARILTILSRSLMTTINSAKQTTFSLLCANSIVRYFVSNNTFQRYVTIENICVSQGKALTCVKLGGKYLYSIQF